MRYKSKNLSLVEGSTVRLAFQVDEDYVVSDSVPLKLPKEVNEYLESKEKSMHYLLLGGTVIATILGLGIILFAYKEKSDVDVELAIFKVYPNPSDGILNVMHNRINGLLIVKDISGRRIKTKILRSENEIIDLTEFNGIFFLTIEYYGNQSNSVKVMLSN